MSTPEAPQVPFAVDLDFNIWAPALRPIELEVLDLTLEAWAAKTAGSF